MRPGQRFVVSLRFRQSGAGAAWATVRWKTPDGTWTAQALDVSLRSGPAASSNNGRVLAGGVIVPPDAGEIVLLLGAREQTSSTDAVWFDDVRVYALP